MAQIFGYARVSTREQNEARQLLALREFGVEDERIFTDRQSGKDFEPARPTVGSCGGCAPATRWPSNPLTG